MNCIQYPSILGEGFRNSLNIIGKYIKLKNLNIKVVKKFMIGQSQKNGY